MWLLQHCTNIVGTGAICCHLEVTVFGEGTYILLLPAVSSMVEMWTEKGILMGQLTLGDSTRAHTSIVPTLSVRWYMDLSSLTMDSVGKKHNVIIDTCIYVHNILNIRTIIVDDRYSRVECSDSDPCVIIDGSQ